MYRAHAARCEHPRPMLPRRKLWRVHAAETLATARRLSVDSARTRNCNSDRMPRVQACFGAVQRPVLSISPIPLCRLPRTSRSHSVPYAAHGPHTHSSVSVPRARLITSAAPDSIPVERPVPPACALCSLSARYGHARVD